LHGLGGRNARGGSALHHWQQQKEATAQSNGDQHPVIENKFHRSFQFRGVKSIASGQHSKITGELIFDFAD
jgi:hypothetical protein